MFRTNILFNLLLLFGALYLASCKKFLKVEEPNARIPNEKVFASEADANSALAGMYLDMYTSGFASGGTGSFAWISGLTSDELHNNPQTDPVVLALEQNNIQSDNSYIQTLWTSAYKTIYQANAIIEGVDASTVLPEERKNQFKGEALFTRALCYFYLTNSFGAVPLVLVTDYRENVKLSRAPSEQIYDQIETDLLSARDLLPENYPTEQRVRPNQSTAVAMLARLYLYKKDWPKAEENASLIIDNLATYSLPVNLNSVFLATSNETIWQIKPTDAAAYTNEGYTFGLSNAPSGEVMTESLATSFANEDKRKLNWVQVINSGNKTLYLPYKYKLYAFSPQPTNEYSSVFRLAEQYLIRAEARANQENITGANSAMADINTIRQRAGLPDTIAASLTDAMGIIARERKLELFTEWGHRWMDLKRWDSSTAVLSPTKPEWSIEDVLFPVPQSELSKSPGLKPQNPGY